MYKFPVTKNGKEYGVSICESAYCSEVYIIRLYNIYKIFGLSIRIKILESNYSKGKYDDYYMTLLNDKTLYKYLANEIINTYEANNKRNKNINDCLKYFKDWDGRL
jgi:hypothetical protein